jgi:hypothetical protein
VRVGQIILAIGEQHGSEEISKENQRSDNDRGCRC